MRAWLIWPSLSLGLQCVGCTDDPLPTPTMNPPPAVPSQPPGALPDLRFNRPPPRDMDPADAGDARLDAGPDAAADMRPDAQVVDARVDAGLPPCGDDPCVLAVELTRCEACPVALPTSIVADRRCTVPFDLATPLFEYVPFDCTAECPQDTLQSCNAPVGQPLCGDDGACLIAQ